MTLNEPEPGQTRLVVAYRWPLVVLAVGVLLVLGVWGALWLFKDTVDDTIDRGQELVDRAAAGAASIASRFQSGTITRTFQAAIPEITGTGSGHLELAKSEQVETFRAEDTRSILWDSLYLGRTVSEIRVPVTYRYHLRLADPWRLEVSGQTCLVLAPAIRPSLPPAIHTDRMEKRSDEGWARFNAEAQMQALEKSVTPTLSQYASDRRHLNLVREQCRQTVAAFVRTWLLQEDHWRTDRFHTIKVVFADEPGVAPTSLPPTLELK